jgi:hypothetical protein
MQQKGNSKQKLLDDWPLKDKKWDLPKVKYDSDGFVTAFEVEQVEEYLKFFDEFGFVVIKNVLYPDEINATINEIWSEIEGSQYRNAPPPTRAQELYIKVNFPIQLLIIRALN